MIRRFLFLPVFTLATFLPAMRAETPALLEEAVEKWVAGTDDWAFTQRVRTFDDEKVKLERLERYDPSRPDNQRWHLLEIDGKPPTDAQREYWERRKNRKPKRRVESTLGKYFDFEHATVAKETEEVVRYEVPLKKEGTRLVPLDKIIVEIVVNKATRSIEQVVGGLREPIRFALGLAKITDMWLDVRFDPMLHDLTPEDGETQTSGAAHVVLFKMGDRAEYAWSEFKRVTPFPSATSREVRAKDAGGS
jgi:hypothetical protein